MYELAGKRPQLGQGCYVAPEATLIGAVTLGAWVSVWPGAVLRADLASITVGCYTNIQDGSILHPDTPWPIAVGRYCTVGHRALVHGCVVEDGCLLGMGCIILNGARVGAYSMVAAGSVVPAGKTVPPGVLVMGNPFKVVRELTQEERERAQARAEHYYQLAQLHQSLIALPRPGYR